MRFGIKGERPRSYRSGFVNSTSNFTTKHESVGSVFTLELNDANLEKMKQLGLLELASKVRSNSLCEVEKLLLRSLHWLSVALTQDETETAIITLMVALESIFKPHAGSSINGTIAESVAFILSRNPEGRQRIANTIREFYSKRSAVAHGGKKPISTKDKTLLIQFVCTTIITVLKNINKHQTQNELMSWIELQKFGASPEENSV